LQGKGEPFKYEDDSLLQSVVIIRVWDVALCSLVQMTDISEVLVMAAVNIILQLFFIEVYPTSAVQNTYEY
jgi:hypothetical protein